MKTCTKCLIEKPVNKFEYQRNTCYACKNKLRKKKTYEISVNEKFCDCCKTTKDAQEFHVNRSRSSGLSDICKICHSEKAKIRYTKNPEKAKSRATARYQKVRGTEEYRAKARERQKRKLQEDPHYLLTRRLRNRLYYALKKKSWKKNTKFSEYIGCTLEELKSHLEKQFIPGMTWENHGEWHIDHIIPLDSANTEEELYKLCHYTNLQPMRALDNIIKGTKI